MTIHHANPSLGRLQTGAIRQPRVSIALRKHNPATALRPKPDFVSAIHANFARVLTRNGIAWRYKPRTFAIEWDSEGNLLDSITPDFYLPVFMQYLELATEQENCVAGKARRLRLLARVHPELEVRLITGPNYSGAVDAFLATGTWKQ